MLTIRPPHQTRRPATHTPDLAAFCIVEHPDAAPTWIRCGSARINPDGSLNVRLDALPLSGELHLRPASSPAARTPVLEFVPTAPAPDAPPTPLHS